MRRISFAAVLVFGLFSLPDNINGHSASAPSFALVLCAAIPTAAQRDDWVEVSSPLAGFRFKMPGQPEKVVTEVSAGISTVYEYWDPNRTSASLAMMFEHMALKSPPEDVEAYLKEGVETFAEAYKGKVVSLTRGEYDVPNYGRRDGRLTVTTRRYQGIEGKIKSARGTAVMIVYMDAARGRRFGMVYSARDDRYSPAESKRFFDSFTLLY